jgi:hypothetical protein
MNNNEILEQINKAAATGQTLLIEKYVTSDNVVKDYVVKLLPEDGYKDLVKQSLDILNSDTEKFMFKLKPSDADMAEWAQAVSEQIDSFNKTLNPPADKKAINFKKELIKVGAAYIDKAEMEASMPSCIILKNIQVMATTLHSENVPDKQPKGNVPKYKELIRRELPIASYIGQLNLSPDKVTSVRAVAL